MDNIFIAYLTITILSILIIYLIDMRRSEKNVVYDKIIVTCPICTYRYIVNTWEKIHKCPQCNSLNKKGADLNAGRV